MITSICIYLFLLFQVEAVDLEHALNRFLHSSQGRSSGAADPKVVYELFDLYNQKYHRTGRMGGNEEARFVAFNDTLHAIRDHYQSGEKLYTVGLNEFSDRTPAELEQMHGVRIPENGIKETNAKPTDRFTTWDGKFIQGRAPLPSSLDFTRRFVSGTNIPLVQAIKNQGSCGSCYAFAFVTLLEFQCAIKFNKSNILSEQQFVDCSKADHGCNGGYITDTFSYLRSNQWQVKSSASYPYRGVASNCAFKSVPGGVVRFGPLLYKKVTTGDATAMQNALVKYGPLYTTLFFGSTSTSQYTKILRDLGNYNGGMVRINGCPTSLSTTNHAVVIVGYGVDSQTNTKYWKVRNSWGTRWGEKGYFRIVRGVNMCGIESGAYYIA